LIYDFRSHQVQRRDGVWLRPEMLDAADAAEWLRLVRHWEALNLAERGGAQADDQ
jgi:hypothetical protein